MMDDTRPVMDEHVLDGNVAGGVLGAVLGVELTAAPGKCAHCGTVSMVGAMRAYVRAPGTVLRCPTCEGVVLRIVETDDATYLDLRGVVYLRITRG
jgi:Zn finger protein HypA/HybF involved in hydrogenase expression